ncbi:Ger(x)C family spore germination protein [Metabacillus idriensis]|uniref:Ger(x)C family spore germination protein n=1 Tax=Metabacillus idriensis TaxID=324768 RepID=UPI003D2717A1
MRLFFLTGIGFLLIVCGGCTRVNAVEDLKLIQYLGYDLEDDEIRGSAAYSVYYNIPKEAPIELLTANAITSHGIFTTFTKQSSSPIEIGKTRVLLMGEEFSQKNLSDLIGTLVRDPIIGNNAKVAYSNQEASEVLDITMKYPPFYFSDVIEQNMESGNTPKTNIHLVVNQYYGEGQDVFLPRIKTNEKQQILMDGLGIYKGDKLTMQLEDQESFLFKIMKDKQISGTYEFVTDENEKIFFKVQYGNRKSTFIRHQDKIKISYDLDLFILLKDYPKSNDLANKNDAALFAKKIEYEISTKIEKLLQAFKDKKVDPLGIGLLVKSEQRDWTESNFYDEEYPSIDFDIRTNVKFLQTGVGR